MTVCPNPVPNPTLSSRRQRQNPAKDGTKTLKVVWRLTLVFATTFPVTVSSVCWMICIFFKHHLTETAWSTHPTLSAVLKLGYVNLCKHTPLSPFFPLSRNQHPVCVCMWQLCATVCASLQAVVICICVFIIHCASVLPRREGSIAREKCTDGTRSTRRWHKSEEATASVSANYSNAGAVGQVASARCPLKSPFGPVHCWQQLQL